MSHEFKPRGSFGLLYQNQFFNGWPTLDSDPNTIVMAFPVERWHGSAAVSLRQLPEGMLNCEVYGSEDKKALPQALAALSLDVDGTDWPLVGERDPIIGELQQKYHFMRPSMFHSPYEAAAAFIIGHRIQIAQTRVIRAQIAEQLGDKILVGDQSFAAFPSPQKLISIKGFKGLNDVKIERLQAVSQAAIDGLLDRDYLRSLPPEEALKKIETLPGVGPFFAQGILYRAVGVADGLTTDDMTLQAIQKAYKLPDSASKKSLIERAENWRPYRMWATVLLHVWLRESGNFTKRASSRR